MRKALIAALAAATLFGVAGCGTTKDSDTDAGMNKPSAGANHNTADVKFAQMMIPHHEQAIEMAAMAESRSQNAKVRELAAAIEAAQDPEIQMMYSWLKKWGEDTPTGMGGHTMGDGSMMDDGQMGEGMMNQDDMTELEKATGAAFDRTFLTMMIEHHEGAIEMAEDEKADGKFPAARSMADDIIRTQSTEIAQMRKMLKG